MKNMKKLVSSVLALTLLAGSAVSMSCSAAGSAKRGQKTTASWYSRAWNWAFGKKNEDKKVDVDAMKGEPGAIDKFNESNPGSYYRTMENVEKAIGDLNKAREELRKAGDENGVRAIDDLIAKFEVTRQNAETRKDLNNPSYKSLIREHIEKTLNSIKNKAISYGLKILIISGLFVLCSILGVSGMWTLLKGAWWVLSFLPKSVLTGLGIYAGFKLHKNT